MDNKDTELTNINIVTPPDLIDTTENKVQVGVFGFDKDEFYKFLNACPLTEEMIIYTIPIPNPHIKYYSWVKDVIKRANVVFFNKENKRMVMSKTDNMKNVYLIDKTFETIKDVMREHGKKHD
ncbi:MAG: hypothetical protein CMI58_03735 [Parcubacteria group bacterium]|jgi:hypothetical protein|nr:hypothetical protein [Parcubacteria group bacterium]